MGWLQSIAEFFKTIPAVAKLFEKYIDLKAAELPMKIEKHEERKAVRVEDAKWDAERRKDKGEKRDNKRDRKRERKEERRK